MPTPEELAAEEAQFNEEQANRVAALRVELEAAEHHQATAEELIKLRDENTRLVAQAKFQQRVADTSTTVRASVVPAAGQTAHPGLSHDDLRKAGIGQPNNA